MNLFTQYGIKEIADVVFYSITQIGDEEFYMPILYLDSLQVSNIEKKESKVVASSGYGNAKVMGWSFGKDITLKLTDALFTPASLSLTWGGWLNSNFTKFSNIIAKLSMANKYGKLNYSTYAYPSPELTDDEWNVVYKAINDVIESNDPKKQYYTNFYKKDQAYVEQNRIKLRQNYYKRNGLNYKNLLSGAASSSLDVKQLAMPLDVIKKVMDYIIAPDRFSNLDTVNYDIEILDRMEKCKVENRDGFEISVKEQKDNILKRLSDDRSSTYIIYYDEKTMLPLVHLMENDQSGYWTDDNSKFKLKYGTTYLKWTRSIKYKTGIDDGTLGKQLIINTDTFPKYFRVVGETQIREQKTGKDQRCQFVIPRAQLSSDTNITLEAAGDPTTFSMDITVLAPPNDIMFELKQFDVEADCKHGGTRVVPQNSQYTRTYTELPSNDKVEIDITNNEIY